MGKSAKLKSLQRKAKKGFRGHPMATIAFYGPTDKQATKVVASIIAHQGAPPHPMRKWFSEGDVRTDAEILEEILAMAKEHAVRSVVMMDRIIGCPHEEGIDYPEGAACPECLFWQGINRWTGQKKQG